MKKNDTQKAHIEIFVPQKGATDVRIRIEGETAWLTQAQIAKVFEKDRSVITKHIQNILKDKEVDEKSNVQKIHFAHSDELMFCIAQILYTYWANGFPKLSFLHNTA